MIQSEQILNILPTSKDGSQLDKIRHIMYYLGKHYFERSNHFLSPYRVRAKVIISGIFLILKLPVALIRFHTIEYLYEPSREEGKSKFGLDWWNDLFWFCL